MNKRRKSKERDCTITLTIPADIVNQVVAAHMETQSGMNDNEYAAQQVIVEWLGIQIDTAFEIASEIISTMLN